MSSRCWGDTGIVRTALRKVLLIFSLRLRARGFVRARDINDAIGRDLWGKRSKGFGLRN